MSQSREYDLILLGATGYTGKLCAEYITQHLPTKLKWAISGRSSTKLEVLSSSLKALDSARSSPAIIQSELTKPSLDALTQRTTVLVNCVGPYHLYSSPVVASCAQNGTHYLDVTGETAWVREMIAANHETAIKNKAILIPEIGIESAPSDLIAYLISKALHRTSSSSSLEITAAVHEFTTSGASGGTLATMLGLFSHYPLADIRAATSAYALCGPSPSKPRKPSTPRRSFLSRFLGPIVHPTLGTLAPGIFATVNSALVHRSAYLNPSLYGAGFRYREYDRVNSFVRGVLFHWGLFLTGLLLVLPPFRAAAGLFVTQPGGGPQRGEYEEDLYELRAIGETESGEKAKGRFQFRGSMYYLTGIILAEAAMVLIENRDSVVEKIGGGLVTPSALGEGLVKRLEQVEGLEIGCEMMTGEQ